MIILSFSVTYVVLTDFHYSKMDHVQWLKLNINGKISYAQESMVGRPIVQTHQCQTNAS